MFSLDEKIRPYKEICNRPVEDYPIVVSNKKTGYYNIPCSFDIETTSFYKDDTKQSIMYIWMFGINGVSYYGRTWEEYKEFLSILKDRLKLGEKLHLVVYVHNLSFEFQYIRKLFNWEKVFAINERETARAIDEDGFEYRCSYLLSGYSLASLGKNLVKYKVVKMVGDLDYTLKRSPITPLTDVELGYCENDVKVVMAYIQEKIENGERLDTIPITKTGYVRNFCRRYCHYANLPRKKARDIKKEYMKTMKMLSLDVDEYNELVRAYQGGFTHANPFANGKVYHNVSSYDFTSSYPTTMLTELYPMSRGVRVDNLNEELFKLCIDKYCCVFDIEFYNIRPKIWYDNPISVSRCFIKKDIVENNGRLVSASYIKTTITEQDYFIIKDFYEWDNYEVSNLIRYQRGYLPTNFIKAILKLYNDKTTLKGIQGKEMEYALSKEMLNSCYGMCVTSLVRENSEYINNEWVSTTPDVTKIFEKHNKPDYNRFLFYGWGVWVTAYARRNLFTGIKECGCDYLYCDTDSIKILNKDNHQKYFEDYNKEIERKLMKAFDHHQLDYSLYKPKNAKGVEKMIGVWDYEGDYSSFKTLGAKRYMVVKDGKLEITIAGVGKKKGSRFMSLLYGDKAFDHFENNLHFPSFATGKMTHTYLDDEMSGVIKDYLGNYYEYKELSGIHLESCEYSMSMTDAYLDFLQLISSRRYY